MVVFQSCVASKENADKIRYSAKRSQITFNSKLA